MSSNKIEKLSPGIVYLSRIPPSMNPLKVRSHFSKFGEVGRLYLQAEDEVNRKRRKKSGGNSQKQFTEGWVEFMDKKVAKSVAATLNNTKIGGKKRYYYHDDIWNIKYLKKFKWGHISEKLAYEKAAREQRMRTEISQAKKEADFYLENVNKSKMIQAIEERKSKKRKVPDKETISKDGLEIPRKFQRKVSKENNDKRQITDKNLLSKIFTNG